MELCFFLFWILTFSAFRHPAKSTAGLSAKIGQGDAVGWSKKKNPQHNYVVVQAVHSVSGLQAQRPSRCISSQERNRIIHTPIKSLFFLSWLFKPTGSSSDLWMKKSEQVSFRLSVIQNPVLHVFGMLFSFNLFLFFFKSVFHPSATSEHSPQPKN